MLPFDPATAGLVISTAAPACYTSRQEWLPQTTLPARHNPLQSPASRAAFLQSHSSLTPPPLPPAVRPSKRPEALPCDDRWRATRHSVQGKRRQTAPSQYVRRKPPHQFLDLRMGQSNGMHPRRAKQVLRMPDRSQAPCGKRRCKHWKMVDLFVSQLHLGAGIRFFVPGLRQTRPVAGRHFRPTRTGARTQLRASVQSSRRCMLKSMLTAAGLWFSGHATRRLPE